MKSFKEFLCEGNNTDILKQQVRKQLEKYCKNADSLALFDMIKIEKANSVKQYAEKCKDEIASGKYIDKLGAKKETIVLFADLFDALYKIIY